MKTKKAAALLIAALMFAGCSSTQPSQNEEPGKDSQNESTVPANVQKLMDASGSDADALSAWNEIFAATAAAYSNEFDLGGDGEVYLFTEDNAGMVDDHNQYDVARDIVMRKGSAGYDLADLTDIDDSYETLIQGFGYIGNVEGSDPSTGAALKLDQTDDNVLKGTIVKTYSGEFADASEEAQRTLMDGFTNFGYMRTVDPVHNASLYDWTLDKKGSDYVISLKVKDVDAFRKAAAAGDILINNITNAPVLLMDNINDETWTYTFDGQGSLKESENTVYHVITAMDDTAYMNLHNKADLDKAEADELNTEVVSTFLGQIKDGSLKEGSAFTIENWD